jgi:hypothetical protein
VTDSQVTIITETGAYPSAEAAISNLGDYNGAITWDETERIPVNRADFAGLVRDQRILRTSRPEGGAAAAGGNSGDYSAGGGNSGDYNAGGGAVPAPVPAPAPGGGK